VTNAGETHGLVASPDSAAEAAPRRISVGEALRGALASRGLLAAFVVAGVVLRVAQYAVNRSFWADESWLALNIVQRSLGGLSGSLGFNQAAPIGFLAVEKVAGAVFGYSEYALRVFPLLCGIAALPAFVWLARRIVSPPAAAFAVLLLSVSDALIYYSSELKPYETDVLAAVLITAAGVELVRDRRPGDRRAVYVAAAIGLVALPFSFAAAFIAVSVAATLAAALFLERRWRGWNAVAVVAVMTLAALALAAFAASRVRHVRQSFEGSGSRFMGVSGSSSPLHAVNVFATDLAAGLGLPQARPWNQIEKVAFVCMLLGAVVLIRRQWKHAALLLLPFVLVFAAAGVHVYPLLVRTVLFLLPVVALLIAEGVTAVGRLVPHRLGVVAAVAVAALLAAGPVSLAATHLVHPRKHEEIKPVLEYMRREWRPGDVLYVHFGAQYALLYYEECGCLDLASPRTGGELWPLRAVPMGGTQESPAARSRASTVVVGRYHGNDQSAYFRELPTARHARRVWFLYTHLSGDSQVAVADALLRRLATLGTRVDGIDRPGAHAYAYRLEPTGK